MVRGREVGKAVVGFVVGRGFWMGRGGRFKDREKKGGLRERRWDRDLKRGGRIDIGEDTKVLYIWETQ